MSPRISQISGMIVIVAGALTALAGLLMLFKIGAPFGLDWGNLHFPLGLLLVTGMLVHFQIKRLACRRNIETSKRQN
jgi:hypothetical protein